ncbi:GMC oxidoreductase [Phanerochaete sordida]|uniref:GMC oxidoreductase n=1 Tax=Phanerochaete sordida TaxID=48140 RepID=A0A9P3G7R5_9APHY|nr:GMC oxidoreductase [Phanerochaete sordida]
MLASLDQVADKAFDYVIIGGGTAGLTLAARLSENPSISVCVLEAGNPNLDDPMIMGSAVYLAMLGNKSYDWSHMTTKQKLSMDRAFSLARGRGLGGSSAMNFMLWTQPPAQEIDDLERLGNPGWNWKTYKKYKPRVEKFTHPRPDIEDRYGLGVHEGDVGTEGAIEVCYPRTVSDIDLYMRETFLNAEVPPAPRPYNGNPTGHNMALNIHDPRTSTRSYAVTGYLLPAQDRANLVVLCNAVVSRLVLQRTDDGEVEATGVEFIHEDKSYSVHTKKEVIVAAGALKSPQVLELSGIGRRDVLQNAGVPVQVELDGVGENLQEHLMEHLNFKLKDGYDFFTFDSIRSPEGLQEQTNRHASGAQSALSMGMLNLVFLPLEQVTPRATELYEKAARMVHDLEAAGAPRGLLAQYKIQLERLRPGGDRAGPGHEMLCIQCLSGGPKPEPGKKYVSIAVVLNHPWSRGSVHITTNDATKEPEIDPRYFERDIDLDLVAETVKKARQICMETVPMKDMIEKELKPGPDVQTDEEFREHVRRTVGTSWHTCGTCSMLPREDGGVVDPDLKVYGTKNVRVVDLSIVPLHFAAHPQAPVYTIAERAADIILGKD